MFSRIWKNIGGTLKRWVLTPILGRKNPRKNTENPEQSWKFQEGIKVWEKKILKWVPKKAWNPEKYWLKIPEILGLEIYKGKNLKKMAKSRGKTFEKFWCWASLENTVRIDARCCKVVSFNDH